MSDADTGTVAGDLARLTEAHKVANKLLGALDVKKVIVVDDDCVPSADAYIAAYRDKPAKAPQAPQDRGWEQLDRDEWAAQVRSWFEAELEAGARRNLQKRALKALAKREVRPSDLELLQQLIGPDVTTMLLPEEWHDQGAALIQRAGGADKALVLFDLNLGPNMAVAGFDLLRKYLQANANAKAAIFTDKVTPDEELEEVDRLTENCPDIRPRTLLASKANLTPAHAVQFLNILRLTASAPAIIEIRDKFLTGSDNHHARGRERLSKLHPRVLEDIVFRSSHEEGAWELDTMLRLIAIFQHEAMRDDLDHTAGAGGLRELVSDARKLVNACFVAHPPSIAAAQDIMTSERWPQVRYINELGLPLANGDVFEIAGNSYILMCQPCDLILRKGGRRKASSSVTLLAVTADETPTETSAEPPPPDGSRHSHVLPPGFADVTCELVMTFSPWCDVDPFVLDLCTFASDGVARIDLSDGPAIMPLTAGVASRYDDVVETVTQRLEMVEDCAGLDLPARARVVRRILAVDAAGLISHVEDNTGPRRLSYDCRRVARLSAPYADAALTALSAERAREAHQHNLDRLGERPITPS